MRKNKNLFFTLFSILIVLILSSCAGNSAMNNATSWPGLSAEDDILYVASSTSISAVREGVKLWSYPVPADNSLLFFAAPQVDDEKIYAGTYSNQVHVLNKEDGTLIQKIELPSPKHKIIASPVVADSNLLIPSSDGVIYAYALTDLSKPVWTARLTSEIWTSPVALNGHIVVASIDKKLNVLDHSDGKVLKTLDTNGAVMGGLVLGEDKIYFSTLAKEVSAFNPESGAIEPLLQTDGEVWAAPLVLEDRLIIADMAGNLYANDLQNGQSIWTLSNIFGDGSGAIAAPVALSDGNLLVIGENGDLLVYDADGKSAYTRSTKSKTLTTPVVLDDSVVVAFLNGDSLLRSYTLDLKENWLYSDVPVEEQAK